MRRWSAVGAPEFNSSTRSHAWEPKESVSHSCTPSPLVGSLWNCQIPRGKDKEDYLLGAVSGAVGGREQPQRGMARTRLGAGPAEAACRECCVCCFCSGYG